MKTREDILNRVAAMFGLMNMLATSIPGASVQGLTIEDIISLAEPPAGNAEDLRTPGEKYMGMSNDLTPEGRFIADGDHLNCPYCGGSGHIDDIQPSDDAVQDARRLLSAVLKGQVASAILDEESAITDNMRGVLSLVSDLVHKRNREVEVMKSLRPVWAQGYTSDSSAAQSLGNCVAQVWKHLGVDNQTAAMQKLRELKP